jgi:serine O-acetyltransferase
MEIREIESSKTIYKANFLENHVYLNKAKVEHWVDELFDWLFCTQEQYISYLLYSHKEIELRDIFKNFLLKEKYMLDEAVTIATLFFEALVRVHKVLLEDLNAIIEFDPAAKSKDEVLITYPGFYALSVYRIAHELWKYGVPILPRLITEYAHSKTGIDIHPAAVIGKRFFIDHGTGIVIGETSKIGNDVKMYQGVTLGALNVSKEKAMQKRHPTIQDNVTIYANATILGGKTVIGTGAVIGGNVWITASIPPQSMVFHKSEIIVKTKQDFPEALNFSI